MDRANSWRPCMTTKQPRVETLASGQVTGFKSSKTVSENDHSISLWLCIMCVLCVRIRACLAFCWE